MAEELNKEDILTGEEKKASTSTTKCPTCGANMVYDPLKKMLYCPYCANESEIENDAFSSEIDFKKIFNDSENEWGKETHVYRCSNCGATEVLAKSDIARVCPYCGTTNIVETDELPGLKPNAIVPFAYNKEDVAGYVKKWAKRQILAPFSFYKSANPEEIQGVYYPAFTFDTMTKSNYSGVLGRYYYERHSVNGRTVSTKKVKYFSVKGNTERFFDDILIHATTRLTQRELEKLKGFNTNYSHEYNESFLSGFSAESATRKGADCYNDAKSIMDEAIRKQILNKYDYDEVASLKVQTSCSKQTYKYVLLPIYVGHTIYKGKTYNFFTNGLTGVTTGKAPKSPVKIAICVILAVALVALIFYLGYLESTGRV